MSGENDSNDGGIGVRESLRRWRALDDVSRLRMRTHRAVRLCEEVMYSEEATISQRLKAASILQQCVRTHSKLIEQHELEERLDRLEAFAERYEQRHERTNGTAA